MSSLFRSARRVALVVAVLAVPVVLLSAKVAGASPPETTTTTTTTTEPESTTTTTTPSTTTTTLATSACAWEDGGSVEATAAPCPRLRERDTALVTAAAVLTLVGSLSSFVLAAAAVRRRG